MIFLKNLNCFPIIISQLFTCKEIMNLNEKQELAVLLSKNLYKKNILMQIRPNNYINLCLILKFLTLMHSKVDLEKPYFVTR